MLISKSSFLCLLNIQVLVSCSYFMNTISSFFLSVLIGVFFFFLKFYSSAQSVSSKLFFFFFRFLISPFILSVFYYWVMLVHSYYQWGIKISMGSFVSTGILFLQDDLVDHFLGWHLCQHLKSFLSYSQWKLLVSCQLSGSWGEGECLEFLQ